MADYERSTTATRLEALPEPIRSLVLERVAASQLTVPGDSPAYLTHSRRQKKPGLLSRMTGSADKDSGHVTALVLGPKDVLVATEGEQRGTAVLTARLEDVDTGSLAGHLAATGIAPEDGASITGFAVGDAGGGTGRGSYFVGLGPPDGAAARAALDAAIVAAKA